MAKWQRTTFKVDKGYNKKTREAIAKEIVDQIIDRTRDRNIDKNGRRLPGYSKRYTKSLDFRIAGKSKGDIDLTLSGDMLDSLGEYTRTEPGKITIGFERGSEENARADGNIRGTYGQKSPIPGKKRDFLGLPEGDLKKIVKKYPVHDEDKLKKRLEFIQSLFGAAREATE